MKNDIRSQIVDYLEKYCKVRDVFFTWAQEKRIDGVLTIYCRRGNKSFTHRFTHRDLASLSDADIYAVCEPILKIIDELNK